MITTTCWDKDCNIAYIVALIMIEKIEILHHQHEGYDVLIQRSPNAEIWHIINTKNDIALRFKNTDTYSQRITMFSKALDKINSHKERGTGSINSQHENKSSLSRKLKAVIGYWTDYFSNKYEGKISFIVSGEKVVIKDHGDHYYTIFYKWLQFDVHYMDIFETLDLLEQLLKGMHDDVEES